MMRDDGRHGRRSALPAVEALERRQLLSFYTGPTRSRAVIVGHSYNQVSVTGGGYEKVQFNKQGGVTITLSGTGPNSVLSIAPQTGKVHFSSTAPLQINQINVKSGSLGSIQAPGADLVGSVTPLGSANLIQFGEIGPNAKLDVGSLTTLNIGIAQIGSAGHIHIKGTLGGPSTIGSLSIDGGLFQVDGQVTGPLSVGALIMPSGQFNVGSVNALTTGPVQIGPAGLLHVAGNLGGPSTIGALSVDGGLFKVDQDVSGQLTVSSVSLQRGGQIIVGNDLTGGLTVTGNFQATTDGTLTIAHNLTGPSSTPTAGSSTTPTTGSTTTALTGALIIDGQLNLNGGRIIVGGDATGGIAAGSFSLSNNGGLSVGRDFSGGLNVSGDLTLASQGKITVGRDLGSLTVGGDVTLSPGSGAIGVAGNLDAVTIKGVFKGKGDGTPDLVAGLDLNNLTINGGQANQGGLQNAFIYVGKNLVGLDIIHGIFNSTIKVGVLIDGNLNGTQPSGGNIGPDGPDAVFDSQITAGVQIKDLLINGNVRSDFVTNPHPTGYPTRIIAGEDPQGNFTSGGNIDNFQITGALIDSVLAASVQPFGGNGTLPPSGYNTQTGTNTPGDGGFNTYDAPAGTITGGPVTAPVAYANFSEVSYFNETATGVAYNTTIDPTIDDLILPGSINASFASPPLTAAQLANPVVTTTSSSGTSGQSSNSSTMTTQSVTLSLPLPTKSTVLGGVISTSHGGNPDAYDFAGIFAADTRGVFVGTLPS